MDFIYILAHGANKAHSEESEVKLKDLVSKILHDEFSELKYLDKGVDHKPG